MLLTVKEEPDHMLVSAGEENEDIAVGYVPFVIGKHTGLADYILNKSKPFSCKDHRGGWAVFSYRSEFHKWNKGQWKAAGSQRKSGAQSGG